MKDTQKLIQWTGVIQSQKSGDLTSIILNGVSQYILHLPYHVYLPSNIPVCVSFVY